MKSNLIIAAAIVLCGCTPSEKPLRPASEVGVPPQGVALDYIATEDSDLIRYVMDWRFWRFGLSGVTGDREFSVNLALRRVSDGSLDELAEYTVWKPSARSTKIEHPGQVVIAIVPESLEQSIFRAKRLHIKFIASSPSWQLDESSYESASGRNESILITNYHIDRSGEAVGMFQPGYFEKDEQGRVILDRGKEWELLLYLKQ